MASVSKSLLESGTGDSFSETHQVPGAGEDVHGVRLVGERGLHIEDKLDVVDARQVARTRRLKARLWVQSEAHTVDERFWEVAMMLVRNHATPV